MNQNCMIQFLCLPQHLAEGRYIVAVHRPQVGDPHIFKQHTWYKKLLNAVLGAFQPVNDRISHHRHLSQNVCNALFQIIVAGIRAESA